MTDETNPPEDQQLDAVFQQLTLEKLEMEVLEQTGIALAAMARAGIFTIDELRATQKFDPLKNGAGEKLAKPYPNEDKTRS